MHHQDDVHQPFPLSSQPEEQKDEFNYLNKLIHNNLTSKSVKGQSSQNMRGEEQQF